MVTGYDCLQIPSVSSMKMGSIKAAGSLCGRSKGIGTVADNAATVCCE